MFGHKHYVAVLRWRRGEIDALQKLFDRDRKLLTPLIEPLPNKGGGFAKIIKDIGKNWGFDAFFLDLDRIHPNLRLSNGAHPLVLMANEAKSMALKLIPVTGLCRQSTYQAAVMSAAKIAGQGICIRLRKNDLAGRNFPMELLDLASKLQMPLEKTHLIVDFEIVDGSPINYAQLCRQIPKLKRWGTFTVLGGAFPENLEKVAKNSQRQLERKEWLSWRGQTITKARLPRKPSFGDYTI